MNSPENLSKTQSTVLLFSIMVVALCGIVYELVIGTVSSYLLGNSVYQFSLTIGLFMFAMGIGSWVSRYFGTEYVRNFITIEIALALVGGISSTLLFMVFPFARPIYELTMYLLILVIGSLVGMEIPILTTLLSQRDKIKDSIANVMSLDYFGALLGSIAFPLLLLPSLGLVQSSFAIGLINILVATVNLWMFKDQIRNSKALLVFCFSLIAMLLAFVVYGSIITRFAEKQLYFDQIVFSKQTPYQKIVVTRSPTHEDYRLYIDGFIQFSSKDEYRYHEYLVHPLMKVPGSIENVLVLGGGDGLAVREILKYPQVKNIHLVDIDPKMLEIGAELSMLRRLNRDSMTSDKLKTFAMDAFSFINQPGIKYDRVIIDMPDPHNEAINKLYSKEFYTMIKRRMSDNGVVVTQSSSPFYTRNVYWSIEKTLDHVFSNTMSYHTSLPSFGIWGFHMASVSNDFTNDWSFDDIETKSISKDSLIAATIFDKDLAKVDAPVNTIMEPKLYQLYIQDLKK